MKSVIATLYCKEQSRQHGMKRRQTQPRRKVKIFKAKEDKRW